MIDYSIIARSLVHYEAAGFKRIESPWTVTKQVSDITRPPQAKDFQLKHDDNKVLVASGEQSFLYLYLKGFLPKGSFQTVTPCFRHESFDLLHTKYFIKNELIKTDSVGLDDLDAVMECARRFFARYLPLSEVLTVQIEDQAYDLTFRGIELGSYGIRRCDYLTWIYGTGVAEPRLSSILSKHGISPDAYR